MSGSDRVLENSSNNQRWMTFPKTIRLTIGYCGKTEIQYYTPENCLDEFSRNGTDSPPEKPEISENTGN